MDYVASKEGGFTLEDLRAYRAQIRPALVDEALGFRIVSSGPPTWYPTRHPEPIRG